MVQSVYLNMSTPTHKALFFHAFNKEAAIVKNVETPAPGPGEILVKIHATALNPVDWKAPKYGAFFDYWPATVGHDGAGEVVQLGEGVSNFTVGDKASVASCSSTPLSRLARQISALIVFSLGHLNHRSMQPFNNTWLRWRILQPRYAEFMYLL